MIEVRISQDRLKNLDFEDLYMKLIESGMNLDRTITRWDDPETGELVFRQRDEGEKE